MNLRWILFVFIFLFNTAGWSRYKMKIKYPLKMLRPYFFILTLSMSSCGQNLSVDTNITLPGIIKSHLSGEIKYKCMFNDKLGRHFLVLTRNFKELEEESKSISLRAVQFVQAGSEWKQEWIIKDYIDCEIVDIEGDFLIGLVSITDLDNNNIFETTVPYSMICAGDVSPKTVKVILRQGETKYAIRGESLVKLDEKTSCGGNFKADPVLGNKPDFRNYLIQVWKKAAGVR